MRINWNVAQAVACTIVVCVVAGYFISRRKRRRQRIQAESDQLRATADYLWWLQERFDAEDAETGGEP